MQRLVEYGVRTLDEHGDVVDVDHYKSRREALAAAERHAFQPAGHLVNAEVGIVVEREVAWSRDFETEGTERIDYETIYKRGDVRFWAEQND